MTGTFNGLPEGSNVYIGTVRTAISYVGGAGHDVTLTVLEVDLGVSVTTSASPVVAGTNETYTVTLTNSGPTLALAGSLTDALPTNATIRLGHGDHRHGLDRLGACRGAAGNVVFSKAVVAEGETTSSPSSWPSPTTSPTERPSPTPRPWRATPTTRSPPTTQSPPAPAWSPGPIWRSPSPTRPPSSRGPT